MGDSFVFLLPLLGGFYFATVEYARRYRLARSTGHRFYFAVAIYGVYLIGVATALVVGAHFLSSLTAMLVGTPVKSWMTALQHHDGIDVVRLDEICRYIVRLYLSYRFKIYLIAFGLGRILPLAFNCRHLAKEIAVIEAIEDNDFEKLLVRGLETDIPILFTLRTGKVYLGWVVAMPDPRRERRWVRILPLAAGYRTNEHQLNLITNYSGILSRIQGKHDGELDHLKVQDFEVVISADHIDYAHLYDSAAQELFLLPEVDGSQG